MLGRLARVFGGWSAPPDGPRPEVGDPRVWVPTLRADDLLEDAFRPIARDGAGNVELVLRLITTLDHLRAMRLTPGILMGDLSRGARRLAEDAAERARAAMSHGADRAAIDKALGAD